MGRISKRKKTDRTGLFISENKRYRAGIYARLSSDRDAKKNESLEVQIEIAKNFVREFNGKKTGEKIDIAECYTDLGKTGSNFEREGFQRLLRDIKNREINCVIVKDLSRFGRNYLEAGNYIEKIFPFLGVRFISVADGYDTGAAENERKQIVSEIKNLVNDMYVKDFSKKAKLYLKQKREEGSYIGGPPPYGYKTEQSGRRRVLVPDEGTADIVCFIYKKFVETESYAAVVRELNLRQVNPPYRYRESKKVFYPSGEENYKGWDKSTVKRILKSETYAGTLVQGKSGIAAGNEKKRMRKPEREWIAAENAHEAFVDKELYGKAAEIIRKIEKRRKAPVPAGKGEAAGENIFDGILYCGICKRKMTIKNGMKYHGGGENAQSGSRMTEPELLELLTSLLRVEFAVFLNHAKQYEYGRKCIAEAARKARGRCRAADRKIKRVREEESGLYMSYRDGKISREQYTSLKKRQEGRLSDLKKQKEGLEREKEVFYKLSESYFSVVKELLEMRDKRRFGKETAEAFISRIYVYPEKRIEVVVTFTV